MQQSQQLETPVVQSEENANGHIVDARFLGAVQAEQSPVEFAFERSFWVDLPVRRPVVGLLKNLIRPDANRLYGLVFFLPTTAGH